MSTVSRSQRTAGGPSRGFPASKARKLLPAPFGRMIKLTDFRSLEEVRPVAKKVRALQNECFRYLPVMENYMLKMRGDAREPAYLRMIARKGLQASCVRNEKRTWLSSTPSKAFFLFSMMEEILRRITYAVKYQEVAARKGRPRLIPFIVFDYEKFRPGDRFQFLPPFMPRFFGQTDDGGLSFNRAFVIRIPQRVADNCESYLPSIRQDGECFGGNTQTLDENYLGLCYLDGERSYLVSEMSLIAHYNLLLVAKHILSFISSHSAKA